MENVASPIVTNFIRCFKLNIASPDQNHLYLEILAILQVFSITSALRSRYNILNGLVPSTD